jgi:hypothetical protein
MTSSHSNTTTPEALADRYHRLGFTDEQAAHLLRRGVTPTSILAQLDSGHVGLGSLVVDFVDDDTCHYRDDTQFSRRVSCLSNNDRFCLMLFAGLADNESAPIHQAVEWCFHAALGPADLPVILALPAHLRPYKDSLSADILANVVMGTPFEHQRSQLTTLAGVGSMVTDITGDLGLFIGSDGIHVGQFGHAANVVDVIIDLEERDRDNDDNKLMTTFFALGGAPELKVLLDHCQRVLCMSVTHQWIDSDAIAEVEAHIATGAVRHRFGPSFPTMLEVLARLWTIRTMEMAFMEAVLNGSLSVEIATSLGLRLL